MSLIIAVHSFRGGTGKSNLTASLSAILAQRGYRVGIVDADIQSPGIHALFDLEDSTSHHSLNDYLWGNCDIQDAVQDVSHVLPDSPSNGRIYLVASSLRTGEIARILKEGYDVDLFNNGLHDLMHQFALDYLFIDTHPGINEETLLSITVSDTLLLILRPDRQDFQGTAVTVDVARRLRVPKVLLAVNRVLPVFDTVALEEQMLATYQVPVAAMIPNADEVMQLASGGIFYLRQPDHPFSQAVAAIAQCIIS